MTRKEYANAVFVMIKELTNKKSLEIWKAIAETDDISLVSEYNKLLLIKKG